MDDKLLLKIRDEPRLKLDLGSANTEKLKLDLGYSSAIGGTKNYEKLYNKPKINFVELIGNRSLEELGIQKINVAPTEAITNSDIEYILSLFK